jgi:hypothetical protein
MPDLHFHNGILPRAQSRNFNPVEYRMPLKSPAWAGIAWEDTPGLQISSGVME